jgi:hypothetical protein
MGNQFIPSFLRFGFMSSDNDRLFHFIKTDDVDNLKKHLDCDSKRICNSENNEFGITLLMFAVFHGKKF